MTRSHRQLAHDAVTVASELLDDEPEINVADSAMIYALLAIAQGILASTDERICAVCEAE